MTIALWEIYDDMFKTFDVKNKRAIHVSMATERITLTIKLNISLEIMINELFMSTLKTRS